MFEIGDALLFTLSAWRQCTWQSFRRAFDDLHLRWLSECNSVTEEPGANVRLNAARLLDTLGHCDLLFGAESAAVFTAPSVLAELPMAGLRRSVLCGSRSPESLAMLQHAASRARGSVHVQLVSQVSVSVFAPARIEVHATSDAVMRQIADDVGIIYEAVPPAWSLASLSGSLEGFLGSLNWSKRPDLTWERTDFDPKLFRFEGRRDPGSALILSRYQDPVSRQWVFWMWRGDESAELGDPSWGRYAVLAASGQLALKHDGASGQLAVPASLPLPRLLSRAATLCSGYAPSTAILPGHADGSRRYLVYKSVPLDVYRTCAGKIGQLPGREEEQRTWNR